MFALSQATHMDWEFINMLVNHIAKHAARIWIPKCNHTHTSKSNKGALINNFFLKEFAAIWALKKISMYKAFVISVKRKS